MLPKLKVGTLAIGATLGNKVPNQKGNLFYTSIVVSGIISVIVQNTSCLHHLHKWHILASKGLVTCWSFKGCVVGTGSPMGVGISSLLVTPEINGEIGAMSVDSIPAGIEKHNKPCDGPNE